MKLIKCLVIGVTLLLSAVIQAGGQNTNGLVAFYPFDGNANDASGHGRHGLVQGATLVTNRFGQLSSAYRFDDVDDGIRVGQSPVTGSLTLAAWIFKEGDSSNHDQIVCVSSAGGVYLNILPNQNPASKNRIDFGANYSATDRYFSTNPIPLSAWIHVAATYDGQRVKLYQNGQMVKDVARSGGFSSGIMCIGRDGGDSTPVDVFRGIIDDVCIYDRALSSNEVVQLYLNDETQPPPATTNRFLTVNAYCRSVSLNPGDVYSPAYGYFDSYFTTYDGSSGVPLHVDYGWYIVVSSELRQRSGQSGVYETDYGLSDGYEFVEYGSATLNIPAIDSDQNGVPDLIEVAKPYNSSISGSGRSDWPSSVSSVISGNFSRAAGSYSGNYTVTTTSSAGPFYFTGTLRILSYSGTGAYTRGFPNRVQMELTRRDEYGDILTVIGNTTFTPTGTDQVALAQFNVTGSDGGVYTVLATTLNRFGNSYIGEAKLADGTLETPWKDYVSWIIEIRDTNDNDGDGVPDFSDPSALPDTSAPTVTLTLPAVGYRFTNSFMTVQGTASDNVAVTKVEARLENSKGIGTYVPASGSNSWTVNLGDMVPGTNTIRVRARDFAGNISAEQTRSFIFVVVSPFTLTIAGRGSVTPNLNGQLLDVGKSYSMSAFPMLGYAFTNWTAEVDGIPVSSTNRLPIQFVMQSNLLLRVTFADFQRPGLAIQFPLNGARILTNSGMVTVRGITTDNWAVTNVFYQLNGGDWTNAITANHWTNWSSTFEMQVGTNVVRVFTQDRAGNRSPTNSVSFQYVVTSPLTLQIHGKGTVTSLTNSQQLELGRSYTFNAVAGLGFTLTNWTVEVDGNTISSTNRLPITFTMASNLTLRVAFADIQKPALTIQSPLNGARVLTNNGLVTVRGTASDNWSVTNVLYQLNGGDWTNAITANNWSNWNATFEMEIGTNLVRMFAQDQGGNPSPTNSVRFQHVVTGPAALQIVGKGTVTGLTNSQQLELGRTYQFNTVAGLGFALTNWTVKVDGNTVASTNRPPIRFMMASNLTLRVTFIDIQKPVLTITSPLSGARITNEQATVRGKVTDNGWVEEVRCRVNGGDWLATGTTNWQTDITLEPGTNWFEVFAIDRDGLRSATNRAAYFRVVTNLMTVTKVGKGTINPDYNGKWLEIRRTYSMTATPSLGFVLTNWTDDADQIVTNKPTLSFLMRTNLALRANFVDVQKPTLTIQSPLNGARVLTNNGLVTVRGITSDNWAVTNVLYSLNDGEWLNATTTNNWTNWSTTGSMQVGTNVARVFAQDQGGNVSTTNSVRFQYVVTQPVCVQITGKGSVTGLTNTQQLEIGRAYSFNPVASLGYGLTNWTVTVDGTPISSTNRVPIQFVMQSNLCVQVTFADIAKPTLTVTAPTAGQRWSNAVFTVTGKVADNGPVSAVWYQLNTNDWATATTTNNWTNWTAMVEFLPGTNLLTAYAVDAGGNRSLTNTVKLTYVLSDVLKVAMIGKGTLSPNYSNAVLEINRTYTMTALPGIGYAFTNWTGKVEETVVLNTNKAMVNFTMQSNLSLTATFVDIARPVLTITAPTMNQRVSNEVFTVTGKVTDNGPVDTVMYQLNGGSWEVAQTANGWSNWTASVTLVPGTNSLRAYAVDAAGNSSPTNTVNFTYVFTYSLAEYFHPIALGNEWVYHRSHVDVSPASSVIRVASESFPLNCYRGRTSPIGYSTNVVSLYSSYCDYSSGTEFNIEDTWYEYYSVNDGVRIWGSDDDPGNVPDPNQERLRADGGWLFGDRMTIGQTITTTRDFYEDGVFFGAVLMSIQLITHTNVTVPAGNFADCLHLRITRGTETLQMWWAKGVGMVKKTRTDSDGNPELYELTEFNLVAGIAAQSERATAELAMPGANAVKVESATGVDQHLQMRVSAPAGQVIVVERSTDLKKWKPLQTNAVPVEGLNLSVPIDPKQPSEFYRVRRQ